VSEELQIINGQLALPRKPGLGIEINQEALRRFAESAETYSSAKRSWSLPVEVNAIT
jgi:hypothetical protein